MFQASVRASFAGSPAIEDLQQALKNLAQAAVNSSWDPGSVSGILTEQTLGALGRSIAHLVVSDPGLRSSAGTLVSALHVAMRQSGARPQAVDLIARFAPQLTMAARKLAYRYAANKHPTPPSGGGLFGLPMPSASIMQTAATSVTRSSTASAPAVRSYPVGSIKKKMESGTYWRIAIPKAAAKEMLGGVDPGMGGDMIEVAKVPITSNPVTSAGDPLPEVSEDEFRSRTTPWYKKWQTWAIAGGAVVVIGGGIVLLR